MIAHPQDAVVRRDFSSKAKENMTKGTKVIPVEMKCLRDRNHANIVRNYEMNRIEKGLDPADLEDDSYPLVEWWKIVELWNKAMVSFDRLERINLGFLAFGECWSWNVIYDALIRWTEVECLNFEDVSRQIFRKLHLCMVVHNDLKFLINFCPTFCRSNTHQVPSSTALVENVIKAVSSVQTVEFNRMKEIHQ